MIDLNHPDALALLRHISAQLDALPAAIAAASSSPRVSPLTTADRAYLQVLFPAVDGHCGACVWTVPELLARAEDDEDLRSAVAGITARQLGKLLSRADGFELNNWRVRRGARLRSGWLWSVERV